MINIRVLIILKYFGDLDFEYDIYIYIEREREREIFKKWLSTMVVGIF